MKITFFSNFLNHHQTPFCDEVYNRIGHSFTFVSTINIPQNFLDNGYPDCRNYVYNLNSYISVKNYDEALKLGLDSDVVIIGSAPEEFVRDRLSENKLTFRYSERIFKKGYKSLFSPRALYSYFKNHTKYRKKKLYMLCASAFTSFDFNLLFAYPNKKYRWGYFTKVNSIDIEHIIEKRRKIKKINILWVGRFLDWKHPEMVVNLALRLSKMDILFSLSMIGEGELYNETNVRINELNQSENVKLLGSIPNEAVKDKMIESDIFLFTSDRNEGWGAVLNEAMSSACAVVVSDRIGSAPFLINNNENGLLFESENQDDFEEKVLRLINDQTKRESMSSNAYKTMINIWSPKNASDSFFNLIDDINNNTNSTPKNGPCSLID